MIELSASSWEILSLNKILQSILMWNFWVKLSFSVWFWFYLILFWSNLTSIIIFLLNLYFEFHKKLLNLIRILQSNLSWFFYIKESFSEKFWFYLILFWSNLTNVSTSFFDFMIYLRFLLIWENIQRMIKAWRSFHHFNSQSKSFYWCWMNWLLVLLYLIHSADFILIYLIDFVDFHWYFEAGSLTVLWI